MRNDSVSPAPTGEIKAFYATVSWLEGATPHTAQWRSESGNAAPSRIAIADDKTTADTAYRMACEGTALLWRGDFQNARQLLLAMARRIDKQAARQMDAVSTLTPKEIFHRGRQQQARRARLLGMLLLQFDVAHQLSLRRAPDVRVACTEAFGEASAAYLMSLRELLGVIGAHEWRKNGVSVAALGEKIYPHYGVFAPLRDEYLDLIIQAPLTATTLAFDIGTGTGVIAALLARRGVEKIIATDNSPRALLCAQENIHRLACAERVSVTHADLFPDGRAPLIVCNPPWLPLKANSALDTAVYDPDSRMLRGFLRGLAAHLEVNGEAWLILSDLAEHLGLRTRDELLGWIAQGGLRVVDRLDIAPRHPRARDATDPLHAARAAEITSLWRLAAGS